MTLTAKDVAEIMRLLEESSFDSLSLEMDGVKLKFQRGSAPAMPPAPDPPALAAPGAAAVASPAKPKTQIKPATEPGLAEVACPLLGIFYRAPKPGEQPFVEVGSKVGEDTVIGIVEVMKLMNSVRAGVKGEVVEILCNNGALVEYGQILLRVRLEA
ncbi:MAG TPA: acetyl-CoA carboxylase biotin carboxyl carrier protein [Terriglobales bacterium]|nr:acetyl-CoA carboxylase biotin carboxyl carrier protein [Terriglobales bacterium]